MPRKAAVEEIYARTWKMFGHNRNLHTQREKVEDENREVFRVRYPSWCETEKEREHQPVT